MNQNRNNQNPGWIAANFAGYIGVGCGALMVKLFCHLFWLYMSLSVLAYFRYIPNQTEFI